MNKISALILFLAACSTGPTPGPDAPPYFSKPNEGGVVRKQNNELVPYSSTEGWYCHPAREYEQIINWCVAPKLPPSKDAGAK